MKEEKILTEISTYCDKCKSKESCHEEECALYRIEQIIKQDEHEDE